jgi:integrase
MAKKRKWLYKKAGRWYGDFRPYADAGGSQEALRPDGERYATKDHPVAKRLAKARLAELKRLRLGGHQSGKVDMRLLGPFVDYHMEREAKRKGADKSRLGQVEQRLNVAAEYFGEDRLLRSITTMHLEEYIDFLTDRLRWEGTERVSDATLAASTVKKYLWDLSKLFRRARAAQIISGKHRPFDDIMNMPEVEEEEAEWLDGPTAALLLEAARLYQPKRAELALPCAYTIVAALLLTGMRPAEGLALYVEDIDFDRKLIRVRRNRHRRLKTRRSRRSVPLWPQLEVILRAYLEARGNPTTGILFPSPKAADRPVGSIKRLMTELAERIGTETALTPKVFRHTYCAARLQTTDGGVPIAKIKVARELGHRKSDITEGVYAHVDPGKTLMPRREYVEFSLADYPGLVEKKFVALQAASKQRNGFALNLANRVPFDVEVAVIERACRDPKLGPRKVAAALAEDGVEVSASGVRWILKRYQLHRSEYRMHAVEEERLKKVVEEVKLLRSA